MGLNGVFSFAILNQIMNKAIPIFRFCSKYIKNVNEFRTRLVVSNRNKRAVVAYVGLGISACSMLLGFFLSLEEYTPWVFGAGVVVILIGAVLAKGRIAAYILSEEELVIST